MTWSPVNERSSGKSKRNLTIKQEKLADGVAAGLSGAEAARRAGYSARSARSIASETLAKPDVQARIASRIAESGVDPKEVVGTLVSHMRANMADFFSGDSLPEVIRIAGERGLGHLIKRIKVRRWMKGKGEDAVTVEEIDFEVARDNPAAVQLSKILRLEQMPQVSMSLSTDEQRQITFLVSLTRRLHAQAWEEGDQVTLEAVLDEVIKWEKEYFPEKDLAPLRPIALQRLADGSFGTTDTTTESAGSSPTIQAAPR